MATDPVFLSGKSHRERRLAAHGFAKGIRHNLSTKQLGSTSQSLAGRNRKREI